MSVLDGITVMDRCELGGGGTSIVDFQPAAGDTWSVPLIYHFVETEHDLTDFHAAIYDATFTGKLYSIGILATDDIVVSVGTNGVNIRNVVVLTNTNYLRCSMTGHAGDKVVNVLSGIKIVE